MNGYPEHSLSILSCPSTDGAEEGCDEDERVLLFY